MTSHPLHTYTWPLTPYTLIHDLSPLTHVYMTSHSLHTYAWPLTPYTLIHDLSPLTHLYMTSHPLHTYTWPLTPYTLIQWSLTPYTLMHDLSPHAHLCMTSHPLHTYTWPLTFLDWYMHFNRRWRGETSFWAQTSTLSKFKSCGHVSVFHKWVKCQPTHITGWAALLYRMF